MSEDAPSVISEPYILIIVCHFHADKMQVVDTLLSEVIISTGLHADCSMCASSNCKGSNIL